MIKLLLAQRDGLYRQGLADVRNSEKYEFDVRFMLSLEPHTDDFAHLCSTSLATKGCDGLLTLIFRNKMQCFLGSTQDVGMLTASVTLSTSAEGLVTVNRLDNGKAGAMGFRLVLVTIVGGKVGGGGF